MKLIKHLLSLATIFLAIGTSPIFAQVYEFTYQGKLSDTGTQSATYDFEFHLCDSASDCTNPLASNSKPGVPVTNGVFTVTLNFGGSDFTGAADLFLEVRVKRPTEGSYTTLLPRQKITAVPYSIFSSEAMFARDSFKLDGLAASQYVQTNDSRLSDDRNPLPGSSNYVQNTNSAQPTVNFNIGGTGTAGILNAATQFNLNNQRILGIGAPGFHNLYVGQSAGGSMTTGSNDSFFGYLAGAFNTTGLKNSFFGSEAGRLNQSGDFNSFFGERAGQNNTTGSANSFFGSGAGLNTTTANGNSFFGRDSGSFNSTGINNSLFGDRAGFSNTGGNFNSFFGEQAGLSNTVGTNNTFFGRVAGSQNTTGNSNTFIGAGAGNPNTATQVSFSTAIGFNAVVSTSNTIVLGTTTETTRIPGLLNAGDLGGGNFNMRVVNTAAGGGVVAPNLYIRSFAQSASGFPLCWRAAGDGIAANVITNCISTFASERGKENVQPFTGGLDFIKRLKPVAFKWTADGTFDIGLNAEDVAEVEPNLVTRNDKGEVEQVKENGLSVLFINAFKEQQTQIDQLREQNKQLQQQFELLKKVVCATNREAEICREN